MKKLKEENEEFVKGSDLPARLKEKGFDIDEGFIDYIPGVRFYREGLLKDGKIPQVLYFSLENTVKFFTELKEFNLPARLKERGYDIDISKLKHFPTEFVNGKYCYNIEQAITTITHVTKYNLQEKLKERGYEMTDSEITFLFIPGSRYINGVDCFDIDIVIEYLNSVTDKNLTSKLRERGYEVDAYTRKLINYDFKLSNSKKGFSSYDIEEVIEFIEAQPQKNKFHIVKNTDNDNRSQENGVVNNYGNNPQEFFREAENFSSHFPISKWYAQKYNTIPDTCFIGQVYIDDLLNEENHKIIWTYKIFTEYENTLDTRQVNILRAFENEQRREIISQAVVEIEDGMFILLTDGRFELENETMYATALLFYKEGINDPTNILLYLSDQYVIHSETGKLGLLYHDRNGFDTHDFKIPLPQIDFNLNYNKGFEQVHNSILTALYKDKGKGLVLLHGKPGTGKTTYLRYLINKVNKNKIFVPPNLTEMLSDPGFIPFLMNNPNCILFVEDAENVLRSREDFQNNQAVSNILNITDGLLSDCLNIQIVATFNTHLKNIDEALLRKGRLIAQYEFTDLSTDRAGKLADSLKVWLDDTSNVTLADIYASKEKTV